MALYQLNVSTTPEDEIGLQEIVRRFNTEQARLAVEQGLPAPPAIQPSLYLLQQVDTLLKSYTKQILAEQTNILTAKYFKAGPAERAAATAALAAIEAGVAGGGEELSVEPKQEK